MDIKERLMKKVLLDMDNGLNREQLIYLKRVLSENFEKVSIVKSTFNFEENLSGVDLCDRFSSEKKICGLSDRTLELYTTTIKFFMTKVPKKLDEIDTNDIRLYLAKRRDEDKLKSASISREKGVLKNFFNWLFNEGHIACNPGLGLEKVKVERAPNITFTTREIELLRNAAFTSKERLVIEMLLSTGCRISELVSLQIEDYNKQDDSFYVRSNDGTHRIVFVNAKAKISMEKYLNDVPHSTGYLILGKKGIGSKITKSGVQKMLKRISERSKVKDVYPHKFRRTSANIAFNRGMKLNDVRLFLGHEDVNSTLTYINQDISILKTAHEKYVN